MKDLKVFWFLLLGVLIFLAVVVAPGLAAHHAH